MAGIPELIELFKIDLRNTALSEVEIIRKHIINGKSYVYQDHENLHQELKQTVANGFGVRIEDVVMVGSGKLGFSIKPDQVWKGFDAESDIDMAIISDRSFDDFWKSLYDFNIYLKARSTHDEKKYRDFLDAFFKGWFRPDYFPFQHPKRAEWFKFLQSISYGKLSHNKKVTCGIFKEAYFFEKYHEVTIKNLRRDM